MYQPYTPPPPVAPPVYVAPQVVQPVVQPVVTTPAVVVQADPYRELKAQQDAEDACCLGACCTVLFCCLCRALCG